MVVFMRDESAVLDVEAQGCGGHSFAAAVIAFPANF